MLSNDDVDDTLLMMPLDYDRNTRSLQRHVLK